MGSIRSAIAAMAISGAMLVVAPMAHSQARPGGEEEVAKEREAMARLAKLDGEWRGQATYYSAQGPHVITQTERVGPMLGGTIRVVEGRGYEADGSTSFNAFAVISYDPAEGAYRMHSYTDGREGSFAIVVTDAGFRWEIPAGPATIRYTATVDGDSWTEVGERIVPGRDPQRFIEMHVTRVGDTSWPAEGAVPPK